MSDSKDSKDSRGPAVGSPEKCEHGVPKPSWRFWTYDTPMKMQEPTFRTVLIDARDCPACLKDRILNLRQAFQDLLYAFAPRDAPRSPNIDQKKFDAAYNAFHDDFAKWGP